MSGSTCPLCTVNLSATAQLCDVCGALRCPHCTMMRAPGFSGPCKTCEMLLPQWSCARCTLINTSGVAGASRCHACGEVSPVPQHKASPAPSPQPQPSPLPVVVSAIPVVPAVEKGSWQCAFCSSKNPMANAHCVCCKSARHVDGQPQTASVWSCKRCTCENPNIRQTCVACGDRAVHPSSPATAQTPSAAGSPQMLSISNRPVPRTAVQAPSPKTVEQKLLEEVENTRTICRAAKSFFVDLLNPLEMKAYHWESAYGDKLGSSNPLQGMLPGFLKSSKTKSLAIFPPEGPKATDVCQGELGDCWLLCVIAVLAEVQPDLIRSLFLTKEVNAEGVFGLKLWKDGIWSAVLIDATFPTLFGGTMLKFAQCQKPTDLWVPLLEKAYAKMCGGYKCIESGRSVDALYDLTGMPCVELRNGGGGFAMWSQDQLIAQLASYCSANCVIAASCGGTAATEHAAQALGLVANHAYSVMRVDVDPATHAPVVVVRNPWGKSTSGLAKHGDQGVASLSFAQFAAAFSSVAICITRSFATAVCIPQVQCTARAMFSLETPSQMAFMVRETAEVYVLAVQQDDRRTGHKYHDVMIMIGKFTSTGVSVVACSKSECHRVSMVYAMLDAGRYCIIPISMQGEGSPMNFTLLSESTGVSLSSQPSGASAYATPHLPSLLLSAAQQFGRVKHHGQGFMDVVSATLGTLDALFVVNKDFYHVTASVNASRSQGMCILGSTGVSPHSTVTVPPGKSCLVVLGNILPTRGGYSCSFCWEYTAATAKAPGAGVLPQGGLFAPF